MAASKHSPSLLSSYYISISFTLLLHLQAPSQAKSTTSRCRTTCGQITIKYPFGIEDGCGSPYYRHVIACTASDNLILRTPSGSYPILNISYSDPHILVSDPSMWSCQDRDTHFRPAKAFSLDTSTHLKLSPQNEYLFFNCSERDVLMGSKPLFCERFPEQCDSTCDTNSFLCKNIPGCGSKALGKSTCCSYWPKRSESLRAMLRHCSSYASVYWRNLGVTPAFDQVPEFGVRIDFEIPVTTRCLICEDGVKSGGTCGFDAQSRDFLCLCGKGKNVTTGNCKEQDDEHNKAAVVAGTVSGVSFAGAFFGVGVWYLRKLRAKAPVTHGVQTNENRLF